MGLLLLFIAFLGISWFFHEKIQKAKSTSSMFLLMLIYCITSLLYIGVSVEFGGWTIGPCSDPSPFFLMLLCFITEGINIIAAAWRRKW